MSPARAGVLLTVVLTTALGARPAVAGWPASTATRPTGTLSVARIGQSFRDVTGTGTVNNAATVSSYQVSKPLAVASTSYVDVANTGTVSEQVSGTVALQTFVTVTVTISRCAVAWTTGVCSTGSSLLMAVILASQQNITWTSSALPAGQALHLRVDLLGSVANRLTLTAVGTPARSPGNRTLA